MAIGTRNIMPTFVGLAPAIGGTPGASLGLAGTVGLPTILDNATPAYAAQTPHLADIAFSASITVTATFPSGAVPACTTLDPLASVSCGMPSFSLPASKITDNGPLQVDAFAQNGTPADHLTSNSLPTRHFVVRQVSDLAPNAVQQLANGHLVLTLADPALPTQTKLYVYDDSVPRLDAVGHISGTVTADLDGLTTIGNVVYFAARTPNNVRKWFAYDDVAGTVTQISNTSGNVLTTDSATPPMTFVYHNKFYFVSLNANGARKLYEY